MRKFLLTFVVLVAGAMSAWADDVVAMIGDKTYGTLAEAVNAAQDSETITMQESVTLAGTVTVAGKNITLDLNGKTISGVCNAGQASLVYIENNAGLTVKDGVGNGKLTYATGSSNVGWTIDLKGALTLESGTIELTGSWSIGYAVDVRPNAWGTPYTNPTIFTMNGGQILSSDGAVRVASSSSSTYSNVSASFVMNGGYIDAIWDGVFIQQSDAAYDVLNFTINGGTVESDLNPVRVYGPAATSYVNGQDCMDIAFNGGVMEYTGTEEYTWIIEGILRAGGGSSIETITESGSIAATEEFVQANELPLPEGYEWKDNGDGTFGVVEKPTTYYINNLNEFLAFRDGVNSGESFADMTVYLNADIDLRSLDWNVSIGEDCEHPFEGVFDGQGNTIMNLNTSSNVFASSRNYTGLFGVVSGNAVIKNLVLENVSISLDCDGEYVGAVAAYANTENGSIENVKVLVDGAKPFLKVSASDVAGVGAIVGYDDQSGSLKISECEVKGKEGKIGTIIGAEYVGGLIGYASSGVIIDGNTVEYLTVTGASSVGAIAGKILTGAEVVDNTIINVLVSASVDASTAAVVAGTFEDGVIISGTAIQDVKVNGTENTNPVSTAAKVGNAYYLTLDAAATDGEDKEIGVKLFGKHTLADDMSYEHTNTVTVEGDLTYTRNLTGNWNPIYFPFDYEFDTNVYTLAEFVGGEGATLTLRLVENGELKANTPYVVRPNDREAKVLKVNLDGRTLVRAEVTELTLGDDFVLLGNNKKVNGSALRSMLNEKYGSDFQTPRVVGSKDGSWGILGNNTNLKPYRLILAGPATVENGQKAISMRILSGTTVVEEVVLDAQEAEVIFDLMGRRVETMTKGEIYIVNGKKVIF